MLPARRHIRNRDHILLPNRWVGMPGLVRGPEGFDGSPEWKEGRKRFLGASVGEQLLGTWSTAQKVTKPKSPGAFPDSPVFKLAPSKYFGLDPEANTGPSFSRGCDMVLGFWSEGPGVPTSAEYTELDFHTQRALTAAKLEKALEWDVGTSSDGATLLFTLACEWAALVVAGAKATPPSDLDGVLACVPEPEYKTLGMPFLPGATSRLTERILGAHSGVKQFDLNPVAAKYCSAPAMAKGVATENTVAALVEAELRGHPDLMAAWAKCPDWFTLLPGVVIRGTGPPVDKKETTTTMSTTEGGSGSGGGSSGSGVPKSTSASASAPASWLPPWVQVSLDAVLPVGIPVELKSLGEPWMDEPRKVALGYVWQCLMQATAVGAPATILALAYVHAPHAAANEMVAAGVPMEHPKVAETRKAAVAAAVAWECHLAQAYADMEGGAVLSARHSPHCLALYTVTRTPEADVFIQEMLSGIGALTAAAVGFSYAPNFQVPLRLDCIPSLPRSYAHTFCAWEHLKHATGFCERLAELATKCCTPGISAEVVAVLTAEPPSGSPWTSIPRDV